MPRAALENNVARLVDVMSDVVAERDRQITKNVMETLAKNINAMQK